MAVPPGFLDELRSRISLSGIVARRVKLVRRGREFVGLCPFHHEKTPSFYVVDDKSFFHCFGCGAHGDAIGFVMRADNLDFIEAIEKLAGEVGLAIPCATPQEREHALRRSLAADFPEPLLTEAGLLRSFEEGERVDYFRSRVIFPIGDRAGRVIAFGGRVIGDGQPKYLNSPESSLFEKGRVLYGWSEARANVARQSEAGGSEVIVTEGYMDVIALHRAGFPTAVAPLGTALTEFQLRDLWRLSQEPILCFDGDAAGRSAAMRVLRRALPLLRPGYSLRFAALSAGEDPDSLIRADGPHGFDQVLAAARPLADKLWEIEVGARAIDTAERRADLRRRLVENIELIPDKSVQEQYRAYILNHRFREATWGAKDDRRMRGRRAGEPWIVEDRGRPTPSPARHQRELLLRMLLNFPTLIEEVTEEFGSLDIPEAELDNLRQGILRLEALLPGLDAETLQQHLVQNGLAAVVDALLSPSADAGFLDRCPDSTAARREWTHVVRMLKGGEGWAVAEASNDLERDLSAENWDRFLIARERALQEGLIGGDDHI